MLTRQSLSRKTAGLLSALLLLGIPVATIANPEQRYYDIEMVLLQNSAALKELPELIHDAQPLELPERYIQLGRPVASDLVSNYAPEHFFKLLPATQYKLSEAAEKIASSKNYRILKHFAWRQPGLASEVALPIVLQELIAAEIPETTTGSGQPEPLLYTQARLDGVITVSLARYLHLETALRFEANGLAPPPADLSAGLVTTDTLETIKTGPSTVVYVDKQRRRMRSSELHYIDHPVIGMLVLITPVELKN